jgi:hypothetical protein
LIQAEAGATKAGLDELAARWEGVTEIRLADGQIIPVDTTWIVSQLRANNPDLQKLSQELATLSAARLSWTQAGSSPADVQALNEILSAKEFQWPEKQPSLVEQWLQKLLDWIGSLFPHRPLNAGFNLPSLLIPGIALLLIILALIYVGSSLRSALVSEANLNGAGMAEDEVINAEHAFQKAQEFAAGGSIRQAVRYLYLSALLALDENGLLRYDRSQTNWEYLRSLSSHPELRANLREVILVFDRVWYGNQPIDEADYQAYLGQVAELRRRR